MSGRAPSGGATTRQKRGLAAGGRGGRFKWPDATTRTSSGVFYLSIKCLALRAPTTTTPRLRIIDDGQIHRSPSQTQCSTNG